MRVTQEVAEQNRRSVVKTAGKLFRENGYDGIGVAALMKAAGLTHGGFYKQFRDKQNLMEEASADAMAPPRTPVPPITIAVLSVSPYSARR